MAGSASVRPLSSSTLMSGQAKVLRNSAIVDRTQTQRLRSPPKARAATAGSRSRTRSPGCERDRSPAQPSPVRGLKRTDTAFEPKRLTNVEKQLYYNPATAEPEEYIKHADIPPLQPLWAEDKGSPRKQIYNYLNSQNLRLALEVEPSTCKAPATDWQAQALVSELHGANPQ